MPGGGSSPYGAVVSAAALLCEPLAFRRNTHSSCKERECSVWRFALISVVVLVVAFPTAAAGQAAAPAGRDIAEAAGLGTARVNTHGETSVRDLDGDGDRDIVLSNHGSAPSELLELVNGGGGERFQLVEDIPFGKRDRHSCAWGNVNSDGRPDLYCSEGGQGSTATDKSNELWVQQPDGSFVDRGEQLGVADPRGRGRDVTFLDVENDGDADLFVGNLPRTDTVVAPNQLYINDGGSFRSAPEYGVNRNLGGNCVTTVDYDRDGFTDLFTCGAVEAKEKPLRLYHNEAGREFRDVTAEVGLAGLDVDDALFENLDGAGRAELVLITEESLEIRRWSGGGYREVVLKRTLGAGRNLAAGDALGSDLDDLYVQQGGERCDGDRPDGERNPDPYTPAPPTSSWRTPAPRTTSALSVGRYHKRGRAPATPSRRSRTSGTGGTRSSSATATAGFPVAGS